MYLLAAHGWERRAVRLALPPHLEHMRDELQRLADVGGPEADLVLDSLGIARGPPPRPKLHAVKGKGGAMVYSADAQYAKAIAKGIKQ